MNKNSTIKYLTLWLSVVLSVSYLLPNHYQPWLSFHADWLSGLAFIPLLGYVAFSKNAKFPVVAIASFSLGLCGLGQWAMGLSHYIGDSLIHLLYLFGFGLAIIAGSNFLTLGKNDEIANKNAQIIWLGFLFAALISFGLGAYQFFRLDYSAVFVADIIDRSRIYANLAQPNQFASLLAIGIIASAVLYKKGKISQITLYLTAVIFLIGIAGTKSRSSILFISLFVFYALYFRNKIQRNLSVVFPIFCAIVYVLFSMALPEISRSLLLDGDISIFSRTADSARRDIFKMSFEALSSAPFFGFGVNQIARAQLLVMENHRALHFVFESSHNLFLDFILTWGVIPGGLIAIYVIAWYCGIIKLIKTPEVFLVFIAISTLGAHAMVEFPLNYAYFLLPMGLWIGQLESQRAVKIDAKIPFWHRAATIVAAIVGLIIFIQVSIDYPKVEAAWRELRYSLAKISGSNSKNEVNAIVLNQFNDLINYSSIEVGPEMDVSDINRMKISSERFNFAGITYKYAVAAGLNGHPSDAEKALLAICKLQPVTTCRMALSEWRELTKNTWPQLAPIKIPDPSDMQ